MAFCCLLNRVFLELFSLPTYDAIKINCSKKVWNITFAVDFCTYFFIIFTWVLHVLKSCSFPYILPKICMKINQVRAE